MVGELSHVGVPVALAQFEGIQFGQRRNVVRQFVASRQLGSPYANGNHALAGRQCKAQFFPHPVALGVQARAASAGQRGPAGPDYRQHHTALLDLGAQTLGKRLAGSDVTLIEEHRIGAQQPGE